MTAEGWYRDPFSVHSDRWFSAGRPTALVRDGDHEAQDEPPAAEYDGPLEDSRELAAVNGEDLLRADGPVVDEHAEQPDGVIAALDAGTTASSID